MDKDKILERWCEYVEGIFDGHRGSIPEIHEIINGSAIFPFGARAVLKKKRKKQSTWIRWDNN